MELAQNASDAAGSDGVLRVAYEDGILTAANTGEPLTAEGVAALASLRASAKRQGQTVGRFGVGFAAVAAVADEVVVASMTGAVRFSRSASYDAVAAIPSLAAELAERRGRVPLLRLPWPTDEQPAAGFATVVRVVVRPDAGAAVERMLADADPALLLFLPGLTTWELPGRTFAIEAAGEDLLLGGNRYRVVRGEGDLDPELLAGRPVEEQAQTRWTVSWAVPVDDEGRPQAVPGPQVVRAPTPTDDPLSLPALLAASLPLGPDRRRVLPGPVTDAVLHQAAGVLATLLPRLADDPSRLAFVPGPLGAGEVDARLAGGVLATLRTTAFLADDRLPADSVVLDEATQQLVDAVADVLPGLLPAAWSARRWAAPLAALGVRRLGLAELVEVLTGADRPPAWWRALYAVLPPDAEALGALPVPLADARTAPGPRGLLVADAPIDLAALGLRVVHAEAAHPLLLRLGAVEAQPRALLDDPRVRSAVEAAADEEDPEPIVQAVLSLVAAAGLQPGELPWLAELPLPDETDDWRPAGELLLPGGSLERVLDTGAGFGVVRRGLAHDDVLVAAGVLRDFTAVPVEAADDADELDAWLATLTAGVEPGPVVRDLDLVRPEAWDEALAMLDRADLLRLDYVRWWLARHRVLGGRAPRELCLPGTPLLDGLLDESASPWARQVGVRASLDEVLAEDPELLLDRLADPARTVDRDQLRAVHAALARAAPDVEPPDRVRAVVDGRVVVVPAGDAVVIDRPDLLPRVAPYAVVPVPLLLATALADLLDLALASEVVPRWTPAGGPEHERIVAPTAGGGEVEVSWVADGGVDHVVGMTGRARAMAWRAGEWHRRAEIAARLLGEGDPAERDLDPPG